MQVLGALFAMSAVVVGVRVSPATTSPQDRHQGQPHNASAVHTITITSAAGSHHSYTDGAEKLLPLLKQISDWALRIPLQVYPANRSIFESGNLVRAVLATHKITGDPRYLTFGLAWCDHLVKIQQNITTSTGEHGGFWDTGMGEVYLADTGTAIAALTVCVGLQTDAAKKQRYLAAMQRYGNFVTAGCVTAPTHPDVGHGKKVGCPSKGEGWVIKSGPDAGALGGGWDSGAYA